MSGYVYCAVFDCFEIVVGFPGDMCTSREESGCEPDSGCECEE